MEALNVYYFLHHFLTHTVMWEVYETEYESREQVRLMMPDCLEDRFFEGADGKIYMIYQPRMMNREDALEWVNVKDSEFQRHIVIEIN